MSDLRDWRPELGRIDKLHIRFGKCSRGHGYKTRLILACNNVDEMIDWWLAEVRPLFGSDCSNPDVPMLTSEHTESDWLLATARIGKFLGGHD